jgi:hypothetical protein
MEEGSGDQTLASGSRCAREPARLTVDGNAVEVGEGGAVLGGRRCRRVGSGREVEIEDEIPDEGRVGLPRARARVSRRAGGRLVVVILLLGGDGRVAEDLRKCRQIGRMEDRGVLERRREQRLPSEGLSRAKASRSAGQIL